MGMEESKFYPHKIINGKYQYQYLAVNSNAINWGVVNRVFGQKQSLECTYFFSQRNSMTRGTGYKPIKNKNNDELIMNCGYFTPTGYKMTLERFRYSMMVRKVMEKIFPKLSIGPEESFKSVLAHERKRYRGVLTFIGKKEMKYTTYFKDFQRKKSYYLTWTLHVKANKLSKQQIDCFQSVIVQQQQQQQQQQQVFVQRPYFQQQQQLPTQQRVQTQGYGQRISVQQNVRQQPMYVQQQYPTQVRAQQQVYIQQRQPVQSQVQQQVYIQQRQPVQSRVQQRVYIQQPTYVQQKQQPTQSQLQDFAIKPPKEKRKRKKKGGEVPTNPDSLYQPIQDDDKDFFDTSEAPSWWDDESKQSQEKHVKKSTVKVQQDEIPEKKKKTEPNLLNFDDFFR